jgi:ribonuclease P protein component
MRYGKRIVGKEIIIIVSKNMDSGSEAGMTKNSRFACIISTKVDKRATRRNRMKRLIRASISHLLPRLQGSADYVFIVKKDISEKPETEIETLVATLLHV